jgi:ABC-type branched-subunit amino acid transport system ATPase component
VGSVIAVNLAFIALLSNVVPAYWAFLVLSLLRGALFGLTASIWRAAAFDLSIPEARARAIVRTQLGWLTGIGLGALITLLGIAGPAIGTGQSLFVAGVAGVVLSLASLQLRDQKPGGVEERRIRRAMGHLDDPVAGLRPSWRESLQSLLGNRTLRLALSGYVAVGWTTGLGLVVPIQRLAQERDLEPLTAPLVLLIAAVATSVVLLLTARGVEKSRRRAVEGLAGVAVLGILISLIGLVLLGLIPVVISPQLTLTWVGGYLAFVALEITVLSGVQPEDRPTATGVTWFSLIGGSLVALGLVSALTALLPDAAAYTIALSVTGLPLILLWRRLRRLVRTAGQDLDERLGVDDDTQAFEEESAAAGGSSVLSLRNVDFSYGSVQVLFDVTLKVNDGEMVALLGPNGVGKTTLLRVLSGLERPQSGTIRLDGEDITDTNASRRVVLGLSQIVGGNAVFGSMTVYENLMMYGFSLGRDRASIKDGIDRAFEVFPKLADRRNQLGSTLSGGEQQMLGLSKALITKPRILVVDEFSLGLAPIVVGELLQMVRALNATGVAVLVVEQSVNLALNLVNRCYFMEKGEIVYEGLAKDLLAQPELVQALSLGGTPEAHTATGDNTAEGTVLV